MILNLFLALALASQTGDGPADSVFVNLVFEFSITNSGNEPFCVPADHQTDIAVADAYRVTLDDGDVELHEFDSGAIEFEAIDWVQVGPGETISRRNRIIERIHYASLADWRSISVRYFHIDCSVLTMTREQRDNLDTYLVRHSYSDPHDFSLTTMRLTNATD